MRIQHITNINVAAFVAIFAISCSKSSTQQSPEVHNLRKLSELPANMTTKELGVVEFSAHTPKTFSLGAGTNCVITPTVLSDGTLKLGISVETKTADGQTRILSRSTITQRSGHQCGVAVGDTMVSLTPTLRAD